MPKKRIRANFYTDIAYKWEPIPPEERERGKDDPFLGGQKYWYVKKQLPDGRLYSGWGSAHPTMITPADLPDDYIRMTDYKKHGYIRTSGVVDLVYKASFFHNHAFKDDMLYISYRDPLPAHGDDGQDWDQLYKLCDEYIWGNDIVDFIFAVEKNSPGLDVSEIKKRMMLQYNLYVDEMNSWEDEFQSKQPRRKHIEQLEDLLLRRESHLNTIGAGAQHAYDQVTV